MCLCKNVTNTNTYVILFFLQLAMIVSMLYIDFHLKRSKRDCKPSEMDWTIIKNVVWLIPSLLHFLNHLHTNYNQWTWHTECSWRIRFKSNIDLIIQNVHDSNYKILNTILSDKITAMNFINKKCRMRKNVHF